MKKLLIIIAALITVTVHAQTNEEVVRIVERAVCYKSASQAVDLFESVRFIRLDENTAMSFGADKGDIVYMDYNNKLYRFVEATKETQINVIYVTLRFRSLSQAVTLFRNLGYEHVSAGSGDEDSDGHVEREFDATKYLPNKQNIWVSGRWHANYDGYNGTMYTIYLKFLGPTVK